MINADLSGLVNQLRSTLGRMEVALGAIADAILWADTDGQVQWCNAAFDKLVNLPHILVLGAKLTNLLPLVQHGQLVERAAYPDQRLINGNYETTEYEFWQGSDRRFLEISGNRVDWSNSADSVAAVLVIREITELKRIEETRKRTEEALRQSEQRFRILVNNIPGIVYHCDFQANKALDFVSDSVLDLYGYPASDYCPHQIRRLMDVCVSEDVERVNQEVERAIVAQQPYALDYRIRRADGAIRCVYERGQALYDQTGKVLGLNGVIFDITDRKRLEEDLRQSQQFLNSIIENIPLAIFVKDIRDAFRYVLLNQVSENVLGISRVAALGKSDYDLVPHDRADFYDLEDRMAVQRGIQSQPPMELLGTNSDRSVLTRTWKLPLFDCQGNATHLLCIAEDVTERTRAEAALRQSEARFRSLYASTSIAVLIQEDDLPLDCNRAAERLFGYSREELLQRHPRELSPPYQPNGQASAQLANQHIVQAYAKGSHRFEWVHRRANGTDFPAEVHLTVFEVDGHRLVQGVVQDLTERKQAEAILQRRAQENSLLSSISRQFVDRADTAIDFALEAVAQFIEVERICIFERTEQIFCVADQWYEASLQPILPFKVVTEDFPWFFNQILAGQAVQVPRVAALPPEASAEKANFQSFHLQSVVCVPMIHAGEVVGYLCAAVIRTARNWTQEDASLLQRVGELIAIGQARHKAEEKFIKAFRASPSPITITTLSDSRFIDVNDSFLCMSGYKMEEVIGHTAAELNMRVDSGAYYRTLQKALDVGSVQNQELEFRTKSGAVKTVLLSIELIDLSGQQCVLNIVNDITERKRLENELISLVSHELRTPMTSLLGALDLLGSGQLGTLTPQGQQVLTIATNNTERLTRLVNDILDLERMRSGKIAMQKAAHNIADLIIQAAQTMQPMADKAQVTLIPEPIAVVCFVDADRLLQTFTNLFSNAIKFSSPGGKIWLSAALEQSASPCLHLTIKDEGRGIPADKLQVIFDRFQQVDASDSRQKGGTGLGLAICRNIVEQHEGKIWAESTLGAGSTFHITLPVTADSSEASSTC